MIVHTVDDTAPVWSFRLRSRGGAFSLTAPGAEVEAHVRLADGAEVSKDCEIVDAASGLITVTWAADDLDVEGLARLDLVYSATGGILQHARRPIDVWIRPEYEYAETP